MRMLYHE